MRIIKHTRFLVLGLAAFAVMACLAIFQAPFQASAYNANATLDKRSSASYGPTFESPIPPGALFYRTGNYTVEGTSLYGGTVIEMVKVPKDAIVVDIWAYVTDGDASKAGNCTIKIGDGNDDDRYLAANNATGKWSWKWSVNATGPAAPYAYQSSDTIDITLGTTGTTVPGVNYQMGVTYKLPGSADERTAYGL